MSHKRYDNPNNTLSSDMSHSGTEAVLPPSQAASELYDRVGATFRVKWQPWATGEPIIEMDSVPDGVTEAEIESALNAMQEEGKL